MEIMKKYLFSLALLMSFPYSAQAMDCSFKYNLKGWSAFYRTGTGAGAVSCSNGQSASVKLNLKAGGFTFGVFDITEGKGKFLNVNNINDIYGGYFEVDGHAGFVKSVEGRALPFKPIFFSMTGKGTGYNLGFSLGAVIVSK